jgi:hypothetical protein
MYARGLIIVLRYGDILVENGSSLTKLYFPTLKLLRQQSIIVQNIVYLFTQRLKTYEEI